MKCIGKLNQKTNYNEHSAKSGHCIANKCHGIYNNLFKNNTKKMLKLLKSTQTQNDNAVNTKC